MIKLRYNGLNDRLKRTPKLIRKSMIWNDFLDLRIPSTVNDYHAIIAIHSEVISKINKLLKMAKDQ